MGLADTIGRQIVKAAVPVALDFALDHMDDIKDFLLEEAKKTENSLDDMIVGVACDWLEGFLQEIRDQVDG